MRNIKFRAWDKDEDQMIYDFGLTPGDYFPYQLPDDDCESPEDPANYKYFDNAELMQFTGLKDKNGKDIYEGDILTIPIGNFDPASRAKAPSYWVVEWDEDGLGYQLTLTKKRDLTPAEKELHFGHKAFTGLYRKRGPESEVIGNIRENPELLK